MHASLSTRLVEVVGLVLLCATVSSSASAAEQAPAPWTVLAAPDSSITIMVLQGDQRVMSIGCAVPGPQGAPPQNLSATAKVADGALDLTPSVVAGADVPLTTLVAGVSMARPFSRGQVTATLADGKQQAIMLGARRSAPMQMTELAAVSKLAFQPTGAGEIDVTLDPACTVQAGGNQPRIVLASDVFKQGTRTVTLTLSFPGNVSFAASEADQAQFVKPIAGTDWFEFTPQNDLGPSVISMNDWLDKPAGKHGGVRMVGDAFQFEDGTPVKLWGTNLCYARRCAPTKENADLTAARFAKYGINGLRMHKFCGEGLLDANDATKFDPQTLDRLDYFASKLTENGVYYGFSHTFMFRPAPGNRASLLAYDEIANNMGGSTYALINIAPDVQDLMIQMVINLLSHKNPYTGKTYAEDPALSYIELQNEDDIFFFTTEDVLQKCPTYRKDLVGRFSDWLKAKYATRDALAKAWGDALKAEETFEARNIDVEGNIGKMGAELPAQGGLRQRMLDNAAFYHDVQDKFYSRFVKAIRDTGYKAPLCGSPWQAPPMLPHYYNLLSDYEVGYIDRHDYAGGDNRLLYTMLKSPGSGYLGCGLQQVADRPFGVSEWITVYPSLYSAEGPALMAAYGMGLQGWDSSYEFQSYAERGGFAKLAGSFPIGVWDADTPAQIGQFPALSRMVMRGDVKEGPVISTRSVSLPELQAGKLSFSDTMAQSGDVKEFGGTVPAAALAAGRVVVQFTKEPQPSTLPDMTKYSKDGVITSATGQLTWDASDKGFFTVNTDGTKAVVGFAEGRTAALGNVDITLQCPYASVFLTALDKGATLATGKRALLSAVARNCNTGFTYFTPEGRYLDNGKAPILLEPVKALIHVAGRDIASVKVLDFDGRETDRTLEVKDGAFTIDGTRDKALYYEVEFK